MSLAKDKQVKLKELPLEYASENQPNLSKRGDFPGCSVSCDEEYRVYQGCAHSFQLECLGDMNICPLCQSFLQNKVLSRDPWQKQQKLSAMLHPRKQASAKQDRQSNNVVNDQSVDDEMKTDNIAEIPKVEREITFINERTKSFPAVYPPAHNSSSFSTAT